MKQVKLPKNTAVDIRAAAVAAGIPDAATVRLRVSNQNAGLIRFSNLKVGLVADYITMDSHEQLLIDDAQIWALSTQGGSVNVQLDPEH